MRLGEITFLQWKNVNFKKHELYVVGSTHCNALTYETYDGDTKNHRHRTIPMTAEVERILKEVHDVEEAHGWLTEYVFSDERGRIGYHAFERMVRMTLKKSLGMCGAAQTLRRTFESTLYAHGCLPAQSAEILGHSQAVALQLYLADTSTSEDKRRVLELSGF